MHSATSSAAHSFATTVLNRALDGRVTNDLVGNRCSCSAMHKRLENISTAAQLVVLYQTNSL
jgi:hypothetical protein